MPSVLAYLLLAVPPHFLSSRPHRLRLARVALCDAIYTCIHACHAYIKGNLLTYLLIVILEPNEDDQVLN